MAGMSYYPTLAEDLARAKQILAEGAAANELEGLNVPTIISLSGGTIYGKDIYAAYKLLESFVEAIEQLQATLDATVQQHMRESRERDDRIAHLQALVAAVGEKVCELALRQQQPMRPEYDLDYREARPNRYASITCPRCGKTSYNLNDVRQRYCGNCHWFHDDPPPDARP